MEFQENKTDNYRLGIIGLGMVGDAVRNSILDSYASHVYIDSDPSKNATGTYEDLVECDAVFVCVPTPQSDDGKCNTSILESVLEKIKRHNYSGVIISKSTAPPGVYKQLGEQYPNLVHCPEFLTAANSKQDFINGKFAIVGGGANFFLREAEKAINYTQKNVQEIKYCSIEEASLAKYAINTFLATKVVFMNELYFLAKTSDINFDTVASLLKLDPRIGGTHMKVPGQDGFGFGGMCFPKDTSALLKYADSKDVNLTVLREAVETNKRLVSTRVTRV